MCPKRCFLQSLLLIVLLAAFGCGDNGEEPTEQNGDRTKNGQQNGPDDKQPPVQQPPEKPVVKVAFVTGTQQNETLGILDVVQGFNNTLTAADIADLDVTIELAEDFADTTPGATVTELDAMIKQEEIAIVMGGVTPAGASRLTLAARQAQAPALLVTPHELGGAQLTPWAFALSPPIDEVARGLGNYALDAFRGRGFGVMIDADDPTAFDLADAFVSGVQPYAPADQKLTQPFVGKRTFETGARLAAAPADVLKRLKYDGADIVFVAGGPEAVAAVARANNQLEDGPLTLLATIHTAPLRDFPGAANLQLAVPLNKADAAVGEMVRTGDLYAAAGSDLATMVLDIIERAPSADPADLRETALTIRSLNGATGEITMNVRFARPVTKSFLIGRPNGMGGLEVKARAESKSE